MAPDNRSFYKVEKSLLHRVFEQLITGTARAIKLAGELAREFPELEVADDPQTAVARRAYESMDGKGEEFIPAMRALAMRFPKLPRKLVTA